MRFVVPMVLVSIVAMFAAAAALFWPQIQFYRFTGHFYPIHKLDQLDQPVDVIGWNETELELADGRSAKLPAFRALPLESAALTESTKRGIEIAPDGRIFGLVRIHHWCGNDPVREHVARVDLSEMLLFLEVGEPETELPSDVQGLERPGGTFSKSGWTVDEFLQFEFWQKVRQLNRDSRK